MVAFVLLKEVGVPICTTLIFHFTIERFQTLPAHKSRQSSLGRDGHLHAKPLPLQKLLTYPVILSVANYGVLGFLDISALALLPLFLAMPLDIGGLNLSPPVIGYIIGSYGMLDAVFQAFCFGPIVRRWGERHVFIAAMSTFIPIFLIFPVINSLARGWGQSSLGVWLSLCFLVVLWTLMDMAYGILCLTFISLNLTFHRQGPFLFLLTLPLQTSIPLERQMDFLKQLYL
jgi:MFS family permease